ncbi:three-helix bundle dimerization domain-containing protein [Paenarthrobacter sp. NPDC089989]|uniref:three-helix bundle dimerization domain-containing protein n=1 Tax=unclassified Paenarthrobacter TaxID=2634190 RepID=UPI0037FE99E3
MADDEKSAVVEGIVHRLLAKYPQASPGIIEAIVEEEYDALDQGRIRAYIPTLAENTARNRVRDALKADKS